MKKSSDPNGSLVNSNMQGRNTTSLIQFYSAKNREGQASQLVL